MTQVYSLGKLEVSCPHCYGPIEVIVVATAQQYTTDGTLQIMTGVDQEKLAHEIERHVSEHHAA